MEWRLSLLVFVTVLYTPVRVTGVTMTIQDTSLVEGQTLQITCQEQSLGTDTLYSLRLQRHDTTGTYQTVVAFNLKGLNYEPEWSNPPVMPGWQARANITGNFNTDQTGGSFVFMLGSVLCNDASTFKCVVSTSAVPNPDPTPPQNVTIHGVTQNLRLSGPPRCFDQDPDCSQCKDFTDPINGDIPGYAEMEKPVLLTCGADFATPINMNTVTWYKRVVNQQQFDPINDNVTHLPTDPPPGNPCTVQATSTLTYYPQPTDRQLRISCRASYQGGATLTEEISICVQGLIAGPGTQSPGGTGNPSNAGLGAGPIAGIIIGVIAVIVLVVVLVYFLWYRRRDGGESYNTREADNRTPGAPPVSKKPEMHENSMYDRSGDPHDNNYYNKHNSGPGKVNQAMDDDYYHHDNDTAPRNTRDPIGSSV